MKSTDELINDLKKQDQTSFLENETDYVAISFSKIYMHRCR